MGGLGIKPAHQHGVDARARGKRLEAGLEAPASAFVASGAFPLPSRFWKDEGPYLAIMVGYALLMTLVVLFMMRRKDVS